MSKRIQESSAGQSFGRMPISGMLDRTFVEKMPWQGQLHPEFWNNETMKLWGAMEADIKAMVNQFIIRAQIPRDQIEDIIFKGSLATYNYTPTSDIDIQVILKYDWDKNPLKDPRDRNGAMLERQFNERRVAVNKEHGYTLGKEKFPVEFFIQTPKTNKPTGASARWSLMKNQWLSGYRPDSTKPGTPPKEISNYFRQYYNRVRQAYADKLKVQSLEAALTAKKELGSISGLERNIALHGPDPENPTASLTADIESPQNLAFKALKRTNLVAFIETEIQKGRNSGLMALKQHLDSIGKAKKLAESVEPLTFMSYRREILGE